MEIVENTAERLVVEDTFQRSGLGFIALLLLCASFLAVALWCDGFIPGTFAYHYVQEGSPRHMWLTSVSALVLAVVAMSGLFRSFSRIVLDRTQGCLSILKVRRTGSKLLRQEPLRSVREARVGSLGDIWRFEIELQSGERLAPRRSYNNYYLPQKLQSVVDRVNEFLAGY